MNVEQFRAKVKRRGFFSMLFNRDSFDELSFIFEPVLVVCVCVFNEMRGKKLFLLRHHYHHYTKYFLKTINHTYSYFK